MVFIVSLQVPGRRMQPAPGISLGAPLRQFCGGDRVAQMPRDEIEHRSLLPMRQSATTLADLAQRISKPISGRHKECWKRLIWKVRADRNVRSPRLVHDAASPEGGFSNPPDTFRADRNVRPP